MGPSVSQRESITRLPACHTQSVTESVAVHTHGRTDGRAVHEAHESESRERAGRETEESRKPPGCAHVKGLAAIWGGVGHLTARPTHKEHAHCTDTATPYRELSATRKTRPDTHSPHTHTHTHTTHTKHTLGNVAFLQFPFPPTRTTSKANIKGDGAAVIPPHPTPPPCSPSSLSIPFPFFPGHPGFARKKSKELVFFVLHTTDLLACGSGKCHVY